MGTRAAMRPITSDTHMLGRPASRSQINCDCDIPMLPKCGPNAEYMATKLMSTVTCAKHRNCVRGFAMIWPTTTKLCLMLPAVVAWGISTMRRVGKSDRKHKIRRIVLLRKTARHVANVRLIVAANT